MSPNFLTGDWLFYFLLIQKIFFILCTKELLFKKLKFKSFERGVKHLEWLIIPFFGGNNLT